MRTLLLVLLAPLSASAFCGFYVGSAGGKLVNNATNVVLLRHGDTTVLSMQNDYQGPPNKFALVVPVPVVLKKADVKTLPRAVFARVDRLAAPRLVEYWEQDPCFTPSYGIGGLGLSGTGRGGGGMGFGSGGIAKPKVRVEAQFAVGEYEIVILSADDSAALDTWLRDNRYNIPPGAEAALRPYVASGMKFFVAKVNPKKVTFKDGRAVLSPLRVAYQADALRLPVRLGLLNSTGKQDLVVHILADNQRYEAANYPNVTIPTNLDVTNDVRDRFGEFYAALFDATLEKNPGAVVTEYAWQANKCDPCPGPVISRKDLATLGGDVTLSLSAEQTGVAVQSAVVKVEGPLDKMIVRRILRRHRNAMRFCAERELARKPQRIDAVYGARLMIAPDGAVQHVKTRRPLPDGVGTACFESRLRRVRFPAGKGGARVQVDADWRFRPGPARVVGNDPAMRFVLTRLHYRYDKSGLGEDLVFVPAGPIAGGREVRVPPPPKPAPKLTPKQEAELKKLSQVEGVFSSNQLGAVGGLGGLGMIDPHAGELETGARPASVNTFQARYAIRHVWTGKVECENPRFGRWGANPKGGGKTTLSAPGMAPVKRDAVSLGKVVLKGVPELGIKPD